jgi:hypothetical protein
MAPSVVGSLRLRYSVGLWSSLAIGRSTLEPADVLTASQTPAMGRQEAFALPGNIPRLESKPAPPMRTDKSISFEPETDLTTQAPKPGLDRDADGPVPRDPLSPDPLSPGSEV